MIEVRDLTKNYGDRNAISHLNFKINKGEVVGFLGPNGAGKTTTMKIITGFMAPSTGEVLINGLDVFENPLEVKKMMGYLPETPPVYGDMVVEDYLKFVAKLKGVEASRVKACVASAIEKTHIGDVRHRLIQNLSKGYRQRVGIAQALVSDPEILILDEPTVGLDPRQVSEIRKLLQQLKGHHTIVLSTHVLSEVQMTCERVIIINEGTIVAEDTIQSLQRKMTGSRVIKIRVRRPSQDLESAIGSVSGVTSVTSSGESLSITLEGAEDVIEAVADLCVQKKSGLVELVQPEADLENIFIQLTSSRN